MDAVNKYIKVRMPRDLTPAQKVAFVWTRPMRTPEFLSSHRDRLRRDWPELWTALNHLSAEENSRG